MPSELQKRNIRLINESNGKGLILYPKDFENFKRNMWRVANETYSKKN